MIQDIYNVRFTIEDKVVIGTENIDGNLADWKTDNGSFQVALINKKLKNIVKIPNINHGDSFKLMRCSGISSWGRPEEEKKPIRKYTSSEFKSVYALLQFHYENGFGPKMGRIFDVNINGETYFAFEQEKLPQSTYHRYLVEKHNLDNSDVDAINTIVYNDHMKDGGFIDMYRKHDALTDNHQNHVVALKTHNQTYSVGYKADSSIFYMKDGDDKPKCFDVDYNTISAYFKEEFIEDLIEKYSDLIDERNFSNYL